MLPDGYAAYQMWLAIRNHFNNASYDYNKYGGKTNAKQQSFDKRRDKAFFFKLSSKYKKELKDFFLSVYCRDGNKDIWIGEMLEDKFHEEFQAWKKRNEAMTRTFKQDVKTIAEFMESTGMDFKDLLVSHNGRLPPIVQLEKEHICPETLIFVDRLTHFTDKYNVHPLWDDTKFRLTKYSRFVKLDKLGDYATILKDGVT